jgi:hypothetical protein
MMGSFFYMRLRKAPFTEFKRVSTSLDDFSSLGYSLIFMLDNIPMMGLEIKENDLDLSPLNLDRYSLFQ